MRLAHRAEQVLSFVFGHILFLWIVGEHCLRTRGKGWIVGVQKPRGWADRFACPQKPYHEFLEPRRRVAALRRLSGSPEFFVAHDTCPADLLGLVLVLWRPITCEGR